MKHLVLLGDSIFDNAAYVKGGPDVLAHLRQQMPPLWRATRRALDGSLLADVHRQILDIPEDATHLIVSAGGNNALQHADILQQPARSSAEVLNTLADVAHRFEAQYQRLLQAVLGLGPPTAVCTIYYPRMSEPLVQKLAVAALTSFNDVIIRQAFLAGIPLIDLRLVCNEDADYANEIEPSAAGGRKIAQAILRLVNEHNFERRTTQVFF